MALNELVVGLPTTLFWVPTVLAMTAGAAGFLWGLRLLRRADTVSNTPTSLIRSAAQGFAEFEGWGHLLPGPPVVAPLTGTVCLWYHVKVVERSEGDRRKWTVVRDEASDGLFLLRDSSGECVVDPEGAHITPNVSLSWSGDNLLTDLPPALSSGWSLGARFRYTEKRLEVGSRLYVMGDFSTHGGSQEVPDTRAEVRVQLHQWKRDYPALMRRFGGNGDGQIDTREWEAVRSAATDEVRRQQRERMGSRTVSLISRPGEGREYVISSVSQERLVQRWRWWAGVSFGGFVLATVSVGWALLTRYALPGGGG